MKIALFADLHFGARGDSSVVLDFQKKSMEYFLKTLKEQNVTVVMIAGDVVDRRKYINYKTLQETRESFFEPLAHTFQGHNVFIIPGNHDCYHKNTIETNALNELTAAHGFNIYNEPTPVQLTYTASFLMLPWICEENEAVSLEAIAKSDMSYVLAHLELSGFEMQRGILCEHGMEANLFQKYRRVLTGHFHKPSQKDNINYLGAPYPMTWGDWDDLRGINILETDTNELTHIPNPYELFHKLVYNDEGKKLDDILNFDEEKYRNGFLKVLVERKENPFFFEKFLDRLDSVAYEAKVIEEAIVRVADDVAVADCEDTLTILRNTVASAETEVDKTKLERFLLGLYHEAINVEK